LAETVLGIEIAAFLIAFFSGLYGVYVWNKKRKEKEGYEKIMSDPLEFHFFIPHKDLGIILKYYKQDEKDHEEDELVISPNFEDDIIILIRPKLTLYINEGYCGFARANA
jgi:hypothetical protein